MKKFLKIFLATIVLIFTFSHAFAWENDLEQAVSKAKTNGKMLFVMFGREACGNCQHLKKMVKDGTVNLRVNQFVIADINCDDQKQRAAFSKRYSSVRGNMLPFVVIARPDGTVVTSRTGYGEAADYNKLIHSSNK